MKEGIGKTKVGLIICVVLVVALAFSNVWLFIVNESLQNQINTLEIDKNNLQIQVSTLEENKSQLESQVSSLQTDKSSLQTQLSSLEAENDQLQALLDDKNIEIGDFQNQIDSQNEVITNLQNQIDSKESEITSLSDQISNLNAQITDLNNQIDDLKAPKLVKVGLEAEDNRIDEPYFLHVYGWVCNVGRNAAYNSTLHLVAYYINGTLAIDTYLEIGPLLGGQWNVVKEINAQINYEGSNLDMTRVTMTLEWTDWTGASYN